MMKIIFLILTATLSVNAVAAQSIDDILGKYLENIGGKEKWEAIKAMKMEGSLAMGGMEFPGTVYSAAPNRQRVEVNVQGQQIVQAYDGETAWWINPFMGGADPQTMPAEIAEQMTSEQFESPFLNYKEKGHTAELVGDAEAEGTATHEIKLTKKDGDVEFYYFDKEYAVPILVKKPVKTGPAKGQFAETYLSDYREVDGLTFPFFIESKVNGQSLQKLRVKSIQINPELDANFFTMPGKQ